MLTELNIAKSEDYVRTNTVLTYLLVIWIYIIKGRVNLISIVYYRYSVDKICGTIFGNVLSHLLLTDVSSTLNTMFKFGLMKLQSVFLQ